MNEVINTLLNNRSIRSYIDKPLPAGYLDEIIKAVQASPSWINGQHVSIISVTDQEKKAKLAELAGGQKHIEEVPVFLVFCADFYRTSLAAENEGTTLVTPDEAEALLVGATDVGIALSNAITAAESLGLSTVCIGAIRKKPLEVIKMLNLPKHVVPISGLCIGYPTTITEKKPRLPRETVFHEETYNHDIKPLIQEYDKEMKEFTARTKGGNGWTWSTRVSSFFNKTYYPEVPDMLKQQGFSCKDMK